MRIDPRSLFPGLRKKSGTQESSKTSKSTSALPQKGQVIRGEIADIQQNNVRILLSDGKQINARMTESYDFNIGQKLSFSVKDSSIEQLLLKPMMDQQAFTAGKIQEILTQANLPVNDRNTEMVKLLISHQMPIGKDVLGEMELLGRRYNNAPMKQLVFLTKNNIEVNQQNLSVLSKMERNDVQLGSTIAALNDELGEVAKEYKGQQMIQALLKGNPKALSLFDALRSMASNVETSSHQQVVEKASNDFVKQTMALASKGPQGSVDSAGQEQNVRATASQLQIGIREFMTPQSENQLLQEMATQTVSSKEDAVNQFMQTRGKGFGELFGTIEDMALPEDVRESVTKILAGRASVAMLNHEMLMSKDTLASKEKVNDHYNKVYSNLIEMIHTAGEDGEESIQKILREAGGLKSSLELMNSLQDQHQFIHLPMMFDGNPMDAQLYVMNDKKKEMDSESTVTALMRLDMHNLLHLDIHIKKTGNNVEIQFLAEDQVRADWIRENTLALHKLLHKIKINVLGIDVSASNETFDLYEDFFEASKEKEPSKRFTFDVRA